MRCPSCGLARWPSHRFCPACGAALPSRDDGTGSAKITQVFLGLPARPDDPNDSVLRVSRYLEEHEFRAPEGIVYVHGHHVRLSIWEVDRAVCAVSLSDDEALRLAEFIMSTADLPHATRSPSPRSH
jgi:hypothetical protein